MAKFAERKKARGLRRKGKSIKNIARMLNVTPGSVSLWCRDIMLTPQQIDRLRVGQIRAGYAGRMKGAQMQKERRLTLIEQLRQSARRDIKHLNKRELFLTGLGIYAGEGYKYRNVAGLTNSDPQIIKFMIRWFKEICNVTRDRFTCEVGINESHRYRIREVEKFWTQSTSIPLSQFRKPSFKKVKSKKIYENPEAHFGTLAIRIRKSAELEYKILGWLHALLNHL